MAWGSSAAADADLNAWYGPSRTVGPDVLELSLWDDNPTKGSANEVTGAATLPRGTFPNDGDTWPNPASGGAITSAELRFGPSVAALTGDGRWWALHDADSGVMLDVGVLSEPVDWITGPGYVVAIPGLTISNPVG